MIELKESIYELVKNDARSLTFIAVTLKYASVDELLSDIIDILHQDPYFCFMFACDKEDIFLSAVIPPEENEYFYSAEYLYNPFVEKFEKFYTPFNGKDDTDHIDYPGWLGYIDVNEFYSSELTSITILDGIKEIGHEAFYASYDLREVIIPDSVTVIGDCAFGDCSQLVNVTIGDGVRNMGEGVFEFCDDNLIIHTKNQYVIDYCKKNDIKYKEI